MKPAIIFTAPHRLLFLVGAAQLIALLGWWLVVLCALYFGTPFMAEGSIPHSLLHAPLLIYLALPPLFFGFLLTVFPRWMGYPDLAKLSYAPVSLGYATAALLVWAALVAGNDTLLALAFAAALLSNLWGAAALIRIAMRERRDGKGPTWHGWSILTAFMMGICGQVSLLLFLFDPAHAAALGVANRFGLWGFLLPVFVTVCHRMIPFFAGSAIAGYVIWRPLWLLVAFWIGTVFVIAGGQFDMQPLVTGGFALLATLTAAMSWKWWPRGKAPALFWVLIISFAWAPAGFALSTIATLGVPLGLAPEHALTIGFASSLIVAMVTRVTQGHSGRPLELPWAARLAFAGIQCAAFARVIAAIWDENGLWLVASVALFIVAVIPWGARNAIIYLSPRLDGNAG